MSSKLYVLVAFFSVAAIVRAETLEITNTPLLRSGTLEAKLHLPEKIAKDGQLQIVWIDSYGRVVLKDRREVHIDGDVVSFQVPLARGLTLQNHLEATLTADGKDAKSGKTDFVITPDPAWDDYQVIMDYAYKTPEQQKALSEIGFTAGHIQSSATQRMDGAKPWYDINFRYYCDQINPAFLSAYHTPGFNPKNKQLLEAKAAFAKDRTNEQNLYRKPCFYDADAKATALGRVKQAATCQMRFKPLFYSTDECGVAELVAPFDFCFDPRTLQAMRTWLIERYGSLEAMNKEWGTAFPKLEDVKPETTDQAIARSDGNYSSWADHRTFMNVTFSRLLKECGDIAKAVDPDARWGIGGAQMPSAFGGYDFWLLSQSMDALEPYDIGNSRELWRSFAPMKPCISTAFPTNKYGIWQLWRLFLHGDRGVGFYDEKSTLLTDDAKLTDSAKQLAPLFRELNSGIGKQLCGMSRHNDPIVIHYSHPSVTAHWMLECKPLGKAWANRMSSTERKESEFLRLRQAWVDLIEDNLCQYRFIAYAELEDGALDRAGTKVCFLPQSIAMSKQECNALRRYVANGGVLVADCRTALMDEHCKMLSKGQLDDLFGIERKDVNYTPGEPGLAPASPESEAAKLIHSGPLAQTATAESITAAKGSTALLVDKKGVPAVIVKDHGKGKTIYLNAVVSPYSGLRMRPEGQALRELISAILKLSDVSPQYQIARTDAQPLAGLEVHAWESGTLRVLGLHRNYAVRINELGPMEHEAQSAMEKPLDVSVDLGRECAVYDPREKRFLGMQRKITVSIDKYEPSLRTILPQQVGALVVAAPAAAKCGEMVEIKLSLTGAAEGNNHAFRLTVLDPQGAALKCYTRNLLAPGGKAIWSLPFALNDAPGEYTLQALDIATGTTATAKLALQPVDK